jgi:hypothetical protein
VIVVSLKNSLIKQYADVIRVYKGDVIANQSLNIEREGDLHVQYAPFDWVNSHARLVIVGLTPGETQANNALIAARDALARGMSMSKAAQLAKNTGSFSGAMRNNLIALLDAIGLQHYLGIASCSSLFAEHADWVHYTSVLRYPVFLKGKNYSGTPKIKSSPLLCRQVEQWFASEVKQLNSAIWLPLGNDASEIMQGYIAQGRLSREQVLIGLPHPSGANAERIAVFCGRKKPEDASAKTNPEKLMQSKQQLIQQLKKRAKLV